MTVKKLLQVFVFLVICRLSLFAQTPAVTTIRATPFLNSGAAFSGTVTITSDRFNSGDPQSVFASAKILTVAAQLISPGVPTVANVGSAGATTLCYFISATNAYGETTLSLAGCTATANATLSSSNYNTVTWASITGASGYCVYRAGSTTAPTGSATNRVGCTSATTLNDQSNTLGWSTVPSSNTTGVLAVSLVPNSGGTPSGTSYTVTYTRPNGSTGSVAQIEYWVVPTSSPLASPGVPTIAQTGTPGSSTYYYWITATNGSGETLLGNYGATTTSNATLTTGNYNGVSWSAVGSATGYCVYRSTTPVPPSLSGNYRVGCTSSTSLNDQSNTLGWATIPAFNTTDPRTIVAVRVSTPPSTSFLVSASEINGIMTVPQGGTGLATLTTHGVLIGQAAAAVHISTAGTAGQCFTSNGASSDPTFQACPGGNITESGLTLSDVTTDNVTSTAHGFAPKSPADATKFLNGAATPAYAQVKDSDLSSSDVTTNNVVSTKHGFAPKSPADATQFLNGAATPAFAAVKDSDLSTSDITTNNSSATKHGFLPKLDNNAAHCLLGDGSWGSCTGGGASALLSNITAATGANSINSGDNAQVWNFQLTTASKSAFTFGENTAGTATGTPILVNVKTLSTSTVNPFQVTAGGTANGVLIDTTGKLSKIGTGQVNADHYNGNAAVAIADGGTGQTTQTAAFNGLDPLTTKGDVLCHNGTDSIRLAVGSNTQVLTADSTQTCGVKWAAGGGGAGVPWPVMVEESATVDSGSPTGATVDEQQVVQLPSGADSCVSFPFHVPEASGTSTDIKLLLNYKPDTAPGTTNNKVKLKTTGTVNSTAQSQTAGDTITLANNTTWIEYTATVNIVTASTYAAGDRVSMKICRDTTVANNAAVNFDIGLVAFTNQ